MWLILSDSYDRSGAWLARLLPAFTAQPVVHVTSADLSRAPHWEHRVNSEGAWFRFITQDDLTIDSRSVTGVINRLWGFPFTGATHIRPADRFYALQEKGALLLSCLHSFTCPMLNPPGAQGLSGDFRLPFEWSILAQRAGLRGGTRVHNWETIRNGTAAASNEPRVRLLVVGDEILPIDGMRPPDAILAAGRRLARRVGCPLLEIALTEFQPGDWRFVEANSFPNLIAMGEPVLPLLVRALALGHSATIPAPEAGIDDGLALPALVLT